MITDIEDVRRVLVENKVIAVVGLSANWWRPSFFAAKYMQDHGYRIIPVNPNYEEVLGEVLARNAPTAVQRACNTGPSVLRHLSSG